MSKLSSDRHSDNFSYQMGPIRPPSEGQDRSLLIRATINCPWNHCLFCRAYQGKKFVYRKVADIKKDIEAAKWIASELQALSKSKGLNGQVTNQVASTLIDRHPQIYQDTTVDHRLLQARFQSLGNVAGWLASGARTVFLQDANSLIMRTPELVEVLHYLKQTFPGIERITSYARAKTAAKKSVAELQELKNAGLNRLHLGLESGSDKVLQYMKKGVTARQQIAGGQKIIAAGITLSEYVMPGLGGIRYSREHALETAKVINEIDPDFIRLRSLIIRNNSPLVKRFESGEFKILDEEKIVDEIQLLIENLNCNSYLASDQMANLLWEIEGRLPKEKSAILKIISDFKALSHKDRLKMRLDRRLHSYLAVYGRLPADLDAKITNAFKSLTNNPVNASTDVEKTINALKKGFV